MLLLFNNFGVCKLQISCGKSVNVQNSDIMLFCTQRTELIISYIYASDDLITVVTCFTESQEPHVK